MEKHGPWNSSETMPRFARGDRVRLASDSSQAGVISEGPRLIPSGFEYEVVLAHRDAWIAEHLLESVKPKSLLRLVTSEELLRDLLLAKLRHPLTEALYAYRASRTSFEPYQFRPALKFLGSPNQGLLIADEVGLGKTIEAAIIYLELKARMDISRVLIICPSRLTNKWQDELRNRFEEEFEVLDSSRIERVSNDLKRLGPNVPLKAIGSFELLRRKYDALIQEHLALDLLIVDEAHHMRNQDTATYAMGSAMVNAADSTLLLSATPLQLHSRDLFSLLNLIAPADFEDSFVFEDQIFPNTHVNRALRLVAARSPAHAIQELRQVERTKAAERFIKNPYYQEILERLHSMDHTAPVHARVSLQRSLMQLNTLDAVMTRTKKREVAYAAVRAAYTIRVTLSAEEKAFYDSILWEVKNELRSRNVDARGFATIMKERQAASCLPAMRAAIREGSGLAGLRLDPDVSQFDVHLSEEEDASTGQSTARMQRLEVLIEPNDTKYRRFVELLKEVLDEDASTKVLIFSFFKRTLKYLHQRLKNDGFHAGVIHGDVAMFDRRRVIERFATDPEQRILLSSEVGAEGLDFQFCDVLVNYDLPWNPMQVEQRIGRLDRFGQEHERIRIYNFYLEDSIETRIFQRLYDRIGIFERSIGDLEAILGDEIREISRRVIQANLTPEEEIRLADQAAERIIQRQHAEEELERSQDELLGTGHIMDQHVKDTITSGKVISPQEIRSVIKTFLRAQFPQTCLDEDLEEECWSLKLDVPLVKYISETVEMNKSQNRLSESFIAAMHDKKWIPITFDSELARSRSLLEFVTIRHPLTESAIRYWTEQEQDGVPAICVVVEELANKVIRGSFFIYIVDLQAVRPQVLLESIVVPNEGEVLHDHEGLILRSLLSECSTSRMSADDISAVEMSQPHANNFIAEYRDKVERKALRDNEALLAARTASVTASFAARIDRTKGYARDAVDERIRRMRESEVQNLHVKRDAKLARIRDSRHVAVTSELIACGRYSTTGEPSSAS